MCTQGRGRKLGDWPAVGKNHDFVRFVPPPRAPHTLLSLGSQQLLAFHFLRTDIMRVMARKMMKSQPTTPGLWEGLCMVACPLFQHPVESAAFLCCAIRACCATFVPVRVPATASSSRVGDSCFHHFQYLRAWVEPLAPRPSATPRAHASGITGFEHTRPGHST